MVDPFKQNTGQQSSLYVKSQLERVSSYKNEGYELIP